MPLFFLHDHIKLWYIQHRSPRTQMQTCFKGDMKRLKFSQQFEATVTSGPSLNAPTSRVKRINRVPYQREKTHSQMTQRRNVSTLVWLKTWSSTEMHLCKVRKTKQNTNMTGDIPVLPSPKSLQYLYFSFMPKI